MSEPAMAGKVPPKTLKFEEFTGETMEQARARAKEVLGTALLGAEPVRDVSDKSTTAQGRTAEEALAAVESRYPRVAFDRQPATVIQEGERGTLEVTATDEFEAKKAWRPRAPRGAQLEKLECREAPSKGLLGIGRKEGVWIAHWASPFIAEVRYKMPAVVVARFFG